MGISTGAGHGSVRLRVRTRRGRATATAGGLSHGAVQRKDQRPSIRNLPPYPCRKYHDALSATQGLFPNIHFSSFIINDLREGSLVYGLHYTTGETVLMAVDVSKLRID